MTALQTSFLWVSGQVEASSLKHLSLSGQQQMLRLVLNAIKLAAFVVVCHVEDTVVPVDGLLPVLLPVPSKVIYFRQS